MEIRKLIVNDVFAFMRIMAKTSRGAREEMAKAIGGDEVDPMMLGMVILQSVFLEAEDEIKSWMANLIDSEIEAFGAMPGIVVLDIIDQLLAQDDIKDFFVRASSLLSKNLS